MIDLKTGGHPVVLKAQRTQIPSPLSGDISLCPSSVTACTCSCEGRKKQTHFLGNREKGREGCTGLHFRGSLALFRFQTSFQNCSALVPMRPGHLNPQVNCKTLPLHPFRRCPFFRAKQQFKQSVPHASHILFSFWYLMQLNCQAIFNSSSDLSYAFMDGQI